MLIDSHAHIKNYPGNVLDFLRSMEEAGIDKSAVYAGYGAQFYGLDAAIILSETYPEKIFAVGYILPENENNNKKTLEALRLGKIRGVKFYLGYRHFYPNDFALLGDFYRMIEKSGRPAIFHTGDTYSAIKDARLKYAHPLAIDDVAVEFPKMKIIIAHLGNPWITDAAAVVYKNDNVYADISGWFYGVLENDGDQKKQNGLAEVMQKKLLDARAYLDKLDKILFGTDFPISDRKSYVEFMARLPVPAEEKERMLCANARELFGV